MNVIAFFSQKTNSYKFSQKSKNQQIGFKNFYKCNNFINFA